MREVQRYISQVDKECIDKTTLHKVCLVNAVTFSRPEVKSCMMR